MQTCWIHVILHGPNSVVCIATREREEPDSVLDVVHTPQKEICHCNIIQGELEQSLAGGLVYLSYSTPEEGLSTP